MSAEVASPPKGGPNYFELLDDQLSVLARQEPVCLYLEVTNRCNLLCTTCPRTFEQLEPEADMSWELFMKIVDQLPNVKRVVLHGVGEPMLVKHLPQMVAYLKERGVYVLFNTNGTLLNNKNGQALIDAGLDELRVSLDAAEPTAFQMVRGKDMFDRIVSNVRSFRQMQVAQAKDLPRVSLWLTGLRETLYQLEAFVRIAESVGVDAVHLQRLVFFPDNSNGMARAENALFENTSREEEQIIERATTLARSLNITFSASGATEPEASLKQKRSRSPWSLCGRPWSLMYFTATGRAIPCCVAPFSMRGYGSFTLGDATQQTLREIWNGADYKEFRRKLLSADPPPTCSNCGLRWSL